MLTSTAEKHEIGATVYPGQDSDDSDDCDAPLGSFSPRLNRKRSAGARQSHTDVSGDSSSDTLGARTSTPDWEYKRPRNSPAARNTASTPLVADWKWLDAFEIGETRRSAPAEVEVGGSTSSSAAVDAVLDVIFNDDCKCDHFFFQDENYYQSGLEEDQDVNRSKYCFGSIQTDAVLSCLGCFSAVCYQCRRNALDVFESRAAVNVYTLAHVQVQEGPASRVLLKEQQRRQTENFVADSSIIYTNPVLCSTCNSPVATRDSQGVYRFKNVVASKV